MEALFSPCTRLSDLLESQDPRFERFRNRHAEPFQELNLDVSTESFLSAERAFTYTDLHALLGKEDTVAWLTPHAAVARPYGRVAQSWERVDGSCRIRFNVDGKVIHAFARSLEHILEICDDVIRLLAASVVHSVVLNNWNHRAIALINSDTLADLMEQCQSLKVLA
jgi:hypothetical protein